jgi:hypothetical protein
MDTDISLIIVLFYQSGAADTPSADKHACQGKQGGRPKGGTPVEERCVGGRSKSASVHSPSWSEERRGPCN